MLLSGYHACAGTSTVLCPPALVNLSPRHHDTPTTVQYQNFNKTSHSSDLTRIGTGEMVTVDHAGLLCSRLDWELGTHDMVRTVPRGVGYTRWKHQVHISYFC